MKRKKRAWNNTNPLYRYLHRRKTSTKRVARFKKYRRVNTMSKRRRFGRKRSGGIMPYIFGAVLGTIGTPIVQKVPMINAIPAIAQAPVVAYVAGKYVLKQNPMKMAIGAAAGSLLFSGTSNILGSGTGSW